MKYISHSTRKTRNKNIKKSQQIYEILTYNTYKYFILAALHWLLLPWFSFLLSFLSRENNQMSDCIIIVRKYLSIIIVFVINTTIKSVLKGHFSDRRKSGLLRQVTS